MLSSVPLLLILRSPSQSDLDCPPSAIAAAAASLSAAAASRLDFPGLPPALAFALALTPALPVGEGPFGDTFRGDDAATADASSASPTPTVSGGLAAGAASHSGGARSRLDDDDARRPVRPPLRPDEDVPARPAPLLVLLLFSPFGGLGCCGGGSATDVSTLTASADTEDPTPFASANGLPPFFAALDNLRFSFPAAGSGCCGCREGCSTASASPLDCCDDPHCGGCCEGCDGCCDGCDGCDD
mmetsp:Transcript_63111/g.187849  ORF Transcript_63111/g.187849 Transcript_63111/m.187849 type:complete len:243 (-) Transcript_63111:147-875(-)